MTDWGVHLIDPLHQCFDEAMPTAIVALGDKFYVKDNIETPDTMQATFHYPKFLADLREPHRQSAADVRTQSGRRHGRSTAPKAHSS